MSEPTGDGKQQPDPDQVQDQVSGSDFSDPTAPVWVDPTAAVPAPPNPPGQAYPYGQQPAAAPQAGPPSPPPVNNPYAQQAPTYGQQPPTYGQQYPAPPYGQQAPTYGQQHPAPPYGQQPPGYSQQYYATGAARSNTSALVLTILSALSLFNVLSVGSLILGIIALNKSSTDPQGSRRMTKIGWIVFGVGWVLVILGVFGLIALLVTTGSSSADFNTGY